MQYYCSELCFKSHFYLIFCNWYGFGMFQIVIFKTKQRSTEELLRKWSYPKNKKKLDNNNTVEIVKVIASAAIGVSKSNGENNETMR